MSVLPESLEELAALYVAGALSPTEHAAVEARRAVNPELASIIDRLAPLVPWLARGIEPVEPPEALRARLLQRATAEPVILRAEQADWRPGPIHGITVRLLSVDADRREFTALVRMAAGTVYPSHGHTAVEESLVLEGDLMVADVRLQVGDFQRYEAHTRHTAQSTTTGCLIWLRASLDDVR